jgi:hypothetical protein
VRKRLLLILGAATLAAGLIGPVVAGAASGPGALPQGAVGVKGIAQRNAQGTVVKAHEGITYHNAPGAGPTIGASWSGVSDFSVAPPDPNGAIGPSSYIEIINLQLAIYNRTGGLIKSANLQTLTGHNQFSLSDPMILWDVASQRFFYNVWDVSQATMAWGFSKDSNPTQIPTSWCNYTSSFGYSAGTYPDYPKLGQTRDFLLIGINFYPSLSNLHATQSDVLWVTKYKDQAPVTTCPASSTFKAGKFANIRNQDGTQAWTPVPAIQVDPSKTGFVMSSSDVECPDLCGTGTKITVHAVRPNPADPTTPQMFVTGKSITVPGFVGPDAINTGAPQKGTTDVLSTLDGRLEHAVSAIDPTINKMVVWTGHSVLTTGSSRTEFRWYEVLPTPVNTPTLVQSGVVKDASLYVFNGAMSPDRTCNLTGCAHGDAVVIGFTTSSSTTFPAIQMVSKIGAGAQSAFVMVHAATTFDNDFTCSPVCRWGDYGGATADPAASLSATHGEVWLTQDTTNGNNTTWNWEAKP